MNALIRVGNLEGHIDPTMIEGRRLACFTLLTECLPSFPTQCGYNTALRTLPDCQTSPLQLNSSFQLYYRTGRTSRTSTRALWATWVRALTRWLQWEHLYGVFKPQVFSVWTSYPILCVHLAGLSPIFFIYRLIRSQTTAWSDLYGCRNQTSQNPFNSAL